MQISKREVVFTTPFCRVMAKTLAGQEAAPPYYSLDLPDYVSIVPITRQRELLLVRQYRPALEQYALELPAGCIDEGETAEACAIRELMEETGYLAKRIDNLGWLAPDNGR